MKKLVFLFLVTLFFASCSDKVVKIGTFNMMSTRNIDHSKEYEKIGDCINCDLKTAKYNGSALNLESAVDLAVNFVPHGEYLMNARIYVINGRYVVSGDVWGLPEESNQKFVYKTRKEIKKEEKIRQKNNEKEDKKQIESEESEPAPVKRMDMVTFTLQGEIKRGMVTAVNTTKKTAIIEYYNKALSFKAHNIELSFTELSK